MKFLISGLALMLGGIFVLVKLGFPGIGFTMFCAGVPVIFMAIGAIEDRNKADFE